ncbi:MAG: hypothetical protein ACRBI6_04515 [Acidimicrobiales bacterium]
MKKHKKDKAYQVRQNFVDWGSRGGPLQALQGVANQYNRDKQLEQSILNADRSFGLNKRKTDAALDPNSFANQLAKLEQTIAMGNLGVRQGELGHKKQSHRDELPIKQTNANARLGASKASQLNAKTALRKFEDVVGGGDLERKLMEHAGTRLDATGASRLSEMHSQAKPGDIAALEAASRARKAKQKGRESSAQGYARGAAKNWEKRQHKVDVDKGLALGPNQRDHEKEILLRHLLKQPDFELDVDKEFMVAPDRRSELKQRYGDIGSIIEQVQKARGQSVGTPGAFDPAAAQLRAPQPQAAPQGAAPPPEVQAFVEQLKQQGVSPEEIHRLVNERF